MVSLSAGCSAGYGYGDGESIATTSDELTAGAVLVNQLGYRTDMNKIAVVYGSGCNGRAWTLAQSGTTKATGTTSAAVTDPGSGDVVCKADFSSYVTAGTGFTVAVSGMGTSQSFVISSTDQYPSLYENALSYFTFHRLGSQVVNITLPGSNGTNVTRNWSLRPTTGLSAYNSWTTGTFNVDAGHADAGDFGLYPENAAHAMWMLMNLYELKAPSTALRDEAAYGVKFFTGILPTDTTKQAAHKCHDDSWGTQNWGGYPSGNDVSTSVRHCMGQSITATYAMARALAQASRMLKASDSTTADNYWTLAQSAWNRANKALTPTYNGPSPGAAIGGGDYQDTDATDDLFDAAVEMYLTAKSRAASYTAYLPTVTGSTWYKRINRVQFDWQYDATDGNLSLMAYHLAKGSLAGEIDVAGLQSAIDAEADSALSTIAANGYPTPIAGNAYPWGSNKVVVNSDVILAYAHTLTGNANYLKGIHQSMDYLMGVNTLGFGFITGYGTTFVKSTHDRQANGNSPKGWLSGGPINASEVNDSLTPKNSFAAKNYYTTDTGFDNAWCSKENAIDWNSPLVWTTWYMRNPASSTCTAETNTAFCARVGKNCGQVTANDNCGTSRTVTSCGTCTSPATCGGGGTANVCGTASCTPETDTAFCTRVGKNCGQVTANDNCGASRTVTSCGTCTSPATCGGGGTANVCGTASCTPETNAAFCTRVGKNCGQVTANDNCGTSRTVTSCGTCTSPATCGGGGTANVCGTASCTPETDAAFCTRLSKNCGSVTANDNCGTSRTVANCGTCTSPATCGGGGTANVCGSAGSTPCAGLCSNPIVFTAQSYSSGNLGSGATCHEHVGTLGGANFGNFVSPRTISVNGTNMGSAGGNITLPAQRNGGYCFQATAGSYDWAYFGTW